MSASVGHRSSHACLLRDVSTASTRPTRRFDAIVVPASRPSLQRVISLSAALAAPVVLLCSRAAHVDRIADRVEATFGARALIVDIPDGYRLWDVGRLTSDSTFIEASAGRSSDLSVKRNIGLMLARLCGWAKILFIDDDIHALHWQDIARLAGQLDRHPVAALATRCFPDNSVVCHARRLAGLGQDVFVSGAVLGVNTRDHALSFFPDIYNEDWFFFAQHAAERSLPKAGIARQDEYAPFADPMRAAHEEFGDLLAEGLFALFDSTPGWSFNDQLTAAASVRYWERFRDDRVRMIAATRERLFEQSLGISAPTIESAVECLRHAEKELKKIDADLCLHFIESWQVDHREWQRMLPSNGTRLSEREALSELGLDRWVACGHGMRRASSEPRRMPEPEPLLDAAGVVG